VFTAVNRGGGLIQMIVTNALSFGVDAFMTYSWGGITIQATHWVGTNRGITLQVQLPSGYDATIEIAAIEH
jgi:hypothetical protein